MMIVSWITHGKAGIGDGILLVVTGVYLGGMGNLKLFFTGLVLAAFWSLWLLVSGKKKRKDRIAFVPFLLLSYLMMIIRWQI